MSDDRHEGLSPAGPADDEQSLPVATPPWTDAHTVSEGAGSQVLPFSYERVVCPNSMNLPAS